MAVHSLDSCLPENEGDVRPWQYTVWTAVCLRLRVMLGHRSTQSGQLSAWDCSLFTKLILRGGLAPLQVIGCTSCHVSWRNLSEFKIWTRRQNGDLHITCEVKTDMLYLFTIANSHGCIGKQARGDVVNWQLAIELIYTFNMISSRFWQGHESHDPLCNPLWPNRGPWPSEYPFPTGDRAPLNTLYGPTGDRDPLNTLYGPTGDRAPLNTLYGPTGDRDPLNTLYGPTGDRDPLNTLYGPTGDHDSQV